MSGQGFSPKIEEKTWSAKLESDVLSLWEREDLYSFRADPSKPVFSIDTPPPYINAPIHIGQAHTYTWMDAIARYKRMLGYDVLFPLGLDRNGLPIEVQAEKEFNINVRSTPRDEFIRKARELLDRAGGVSTDTLRRLGHSYNSWQKKYAIGGSYETDDPEYRRMTQETFIDLYKKGLIYEGEKTTNYCPSCHTAISDAEVEYREHTALLNHIEFDVDGKKAVIATTRPELLPACKLVIYNPEDARYEGLAGKSATVPIFGFRVPIMEHPYAKQEYGTGLVMICSYGDYADIRILRELGVEPTYVIDKEGRMTEKAGAYANLTVKQARSKVIEDLKQSGLYVKGEQTQHREPICWRSKTPVEFIPLKEIYLKQVDFKDRLLATIDRMSFHSPESKKILVDWINSVSVDWVLSRRRYYGTEIPLWYCNGCGETIVPEPGRYYMPWKEPPPVQACPKCGSNSFRGEERILDTWFDSGSSQQYILGYLWDKKKFTENYPCTMRPQGKEIVRTWLYFTVLKSLLLFGRPPFRDVWINYHVVDEKGEKMSKSVGNVIDPQEILKRYGAEAFRLWAFLEGNIANGDIRYSHQRTEGNAKFLTKLWNIGRLISSFPVPDGASPTPSEEWIFAELARTASEVRGSLDAYDLNQAATSLRGFAWNLFADHYMEMVKARAYGGPGISAEAQKAAWYGLHHTFSNTLLLLSPIVPFITDYLWRAMYKKESIHRGAFPEIKADAKRLQVTPRLVEFNSKVWNEKKAKGRSLRESIQVEIPEELEPFAQDIRLMHNISS
ncbi:MAG: valine--tRNA ligase [Nitrososphaerota archaeon]|nr:valine--tRNA ligase [Nitrososphaerota archaeon]